MKTLNIEKFNPTKAEITSLVEKYKSLTISGIDDKAGYEAVHKARVELKNVRVNITKTGKSMREEALKFQKDVIAKEKELVEMVEPTERELESKQQAIDEEKEKIKRQSLLPERREKLQSINVVVEDDFLLLMDEARFTEFFNQKNTEFLAEKERLMKEEQEKLEAEKRAMQDKKDAEEREAKHQEELVQARKEAVEQAAKDAANHARIEAEQKVKAEEQKIAVQKASQAKLESDKKYQDFLTKHAYNEEDFYIERAGNRVVLYKKVGEITI